MTPYETEPANVQLNKHDFQGIYINFNYSGISMLGTSEIFATL